MVDNDNSVEIENASEIKSDAVDPLNSSITDDSTVNDETITSSVDDTEDKTVENNSGIEVDQSIEENTETPDNDKKSKTDVKSDSVTDVTASLWKYKPIPENEPDPYPEYLTEYKVLDNITIIGARVRGKKHKHEGTNCDDWFETASCGSITFIAVSDGAGSKKYSRIGAKTACQTAVGYLSSTFNSAIEANMELVDDLSLPLSDEKCISACKTVAGIIQDSVVKAYNAVESEFYQKYTQSDYSNALGRNISIKDFSSTFLIAAIIPISGNDNEKLVVSCQIGDGMIALINSNESYERSVKLMGEPDNGDFSGETDFLINKKLIESHSLASRTKLSRGKSDYIFLMTDGVADDYFPNEAEMHRLYLDLLANGIIQPTPSLTVNELSSQQVDMIKKIPAPSSYPWVNDHSVSIGLNYTNRIIDKLNVSLEELWDYRTILSVATIGLNDAMKDDDLSSRLKIWLDNYVERGSFDDRTLVIAQI